MYVNFTSETHSLQDFMFGLQCFDCVSAEVASKNDSLSHCTVTNGSFYITKYFPFADTDKTDRELLSTTELNKPQKVRCFFVLLTLHVWNSLQTSHSVSNLCFKKRKHDVVNLDFRSFMFCTHYLLIKKRSYCVPVLCFYFVPSEFVVFLSKLQ